MRFGETATRARCRVKKPRVCRVTKSFLWRPRPRRKAPAGHCAAFFRVGIVCRLSAGARYRGRKWGHCGACVPPGCFACAMQPPTAKASLPGGQHTRAGPGHSRQRVIVRGCGRARCRVMKPAGVKGQAMPPQALELPGVAGAGADTFPKQRFRKLPQ